MKRLIFIIVLLVLILIAWFFFIRSQGTSQPEPSNEIIPILSEFSGKVVYTTDVLLDPIPFQLDCLQRDGAFNACGDTCEIGAENCAQVCAFTCRYDRDAVHIPGTWELFRNNAIGFSITHAPNMQVAGNDERIQISYLGPKQTPGTEIFDGIAVTIQQRTIPADQTLAAFVDTEVENAESVGTIIEEPRPTKVNGQEAITFRALTLGEFTHYYFQVSETKIVSVSYIAPDPDERGYAETVRKMLATLAIYPANLASITDFAGCSDAGYPILESSPRQCRLPDGRRFTE